MNNKSYCEACDKKVQYSISLEVESIEMSGVVFNESIISCNCNYCGNEVFVDYIDNINNYNINKIYRNRFDIVQQEDIVKILAESNLSVGEFAKEIGVSKDTFLRFLFGQTPSVECSNRIKAIE